MLWLRAKPRFLPWAGVSMRSESGGLLFECRTDLRLRSEIAYNRNENSLVLDRVVRSLLQGCETGNFPTPDYATPRVPPAKHVKPVAV